MVIGMALGPVDIAPKLIVYELLDDLPLIELDSGLSAQRVAIIEQIRLPRVVLGFLVGATLSVSGAAYQGAFRNPLADPYLLGIAAGAGLGATVAITQDWGDGGGFTDPVPLAAFAGALLAIVLSYTAGHVGGRSTASLILAGVAVAITLGGPGALFWMWLIALLGMATSLFECALAQLYKRRHGDETFRGGPAYVMRHGLGWRWLPVVYSVLLLVTIGFGFNAVQSYVVTTSIESAFGVPAVASGVVMTAVMAIILFGGIRRLALVSEVVVPLMVLGYLALALVVLALNVTEIPSALALIFSSAFGLEQAVGGGVAAAIAQGARRGLFSNEAGLGTVPNVA
ncbi:MAG: hypothetical protein EBY61_06510, partial [Actinobacteria bacterium]|nr:hypothetical protein [Actinomycetota bacterium]